MTNTSSICKDKRKLTFSFKKKVAQETSKIEAWKWDFQFLCIPYMIHNDRVWDLSLSLTNSKKRSENLKAIKEEAIIYPKQDNMHFLKKYLSVIFPQKIIQSISLKSKQNTFEIEMSKCFNFQTQHAKCQPLPCITTHFEHHSTPDYQKGWETCICINR